MTILFFARRFYPLIGGVEKHVLEISKRLVKKGFKVIVITENYNISRSNRYQSKPLFAKSVDNVEGIKIIRIDAGKEGRLKKFRVWWRLLKHFKILKDADIVHCHDIFFWYLPFRFIFPFKKVYTTFHGYEGNELPTKKTIFMHKVAEKLSYGNICVGDYLKKWYGTKPNIVTYGAVDENLIKKGNKIIKPDKDIMFLGRLEEETGFMEYLEALRKLNLNMDVFGEGKLESEARNFSNNNNLSVNFKGFVKNATDYIPDYKFVFTSRYLGILEAMAAKKPVFAQYNNPIKKDYLKLTPFSSYISISSNVNQLTSAVNDYVDGKSNIDINRAYDWVKNQTWEKMTDLYLKLWGIR